jgi:flavorubredoxin
MQNEVDFGRNYQLGYCPGFCMQIEYGLKRGTTDNSYLVKGQTHTALIDIPDQAFSKAFLETLATTTDLKRLTYLILGHFSPKRVESLVGLADALAERGRLSQELCYFLLMLLQNPVSSFAKWSCFLIC